MEPYALKIKKDEIMNSDLKGKERQQKLVALDTELLNWAINEDLPGIVTNLVSQNAELVEKNDALLSRVNDLEGLDINDRMAKLEERKAKLKESGEVEPMDEESIKKIVKESIAEGMKEIKTEIEEDLGDKFVQQQDPVFTTAEDVTKIVSKTLDKNPVLRDLQNMITGKCDNPECPAILSVGIEICPTCNRKQDWSGYFKGFQLKKVDPGP